MAKRIFLGLIGLSIFLSVVGLIIYYSYFSPPQPASASEVTFVVPQNSNTPAVILELQKQGFIKSIAAFELVRKLFKYGDILPGGYNLSKNETVFMVAHDLFRDPPDLKWFTFPEGWRKEQIGEKLAQDLNWSPAELTDWTEKYTALTYDYVEGVYFPDTYLIPVAEKNFEVAQRLISRFNEKFSGYPEKFAAKNILWTTGLKIASLIQRETADPADMPIISGVIWNRLNQGMKLQIDATLQYIKGSSGSGWWAPVGPNDKNLVSPYNSYQNPGLPPHPICNPGLAAIEAALNPADTDCLFYLHGPDRVMHCSDTYAGHLQNISDYLKK